MTFSNLTPTSSDRPSSAEELQVRDPLLDVASRRNSTQTGSFQVDSQRPVLEEFDQQAAAPVQIGQSAEQSVEQRSLVARISEPFLQAQFSQHSPGGELIVKEFQQRPREMDFAIRRDLSQTRLHSVDKLRRLLEKFDQSAPAPIQHRLSAEQSEELRSLVARISKQCLQAPGSQNGPGGKPLDVTHLMCTQTGGMRAFDIRLAAPRSRWPNFQTLITIGEIYLTAKLRRRPVEVLRREMFPLRILSIGVAIWNKNYYKALLDLTAVAALSLPYGVAISMTIDVASEVANCYFCHRTTRNR